MVSYPLENSVEREAVPVRIIISPAKKMNVDRDSLPWRDLPRFLPRTEVILTRLREMEYGELKALWKCNDQIAKLNVARLQTMDLRRDLTPAILSYEGIQYRYMAPGVFTDRELSYVAEHLRILSGFYGLLRPFDGVTPYRLEMQARLNTCEGKDLYEFWGSSVGESLFGESRCVLNLASREYSRSVSAYLPEDVSFLTCVFAERKGGKLIEKGTMCKMARGEMVRYMAQHQMEDPARVRDFHRLGYAYAPEESGPDTYVFVKEEARAEG